MVKSKNDKQLTMDDVARHLGLSKATVSLALNDNPVVASATRIRVVKAAKELGYRPNYFARRLAQGRSETVGLFILTSETGCCDWTLPSSWMFYHPILQRITSELSANSYRLLLEIIHLEEDEKCEDFVQRAQEGFLDGIIVVVQDDICYNFIVEAIDDQFPLVILNAGSEKRASCVKIDNGGGAAAVVEYLVGLGHEKIAHIGGPRLDLSALERRQGFCRALEAANLQVNQQYLKEGDWQIRCGVKLTEEFIALKERPSAIFCANDHMALGALHAAQARGLRVPEDISIVGFDDIEMCQVTTPRITSVRQPLQKMGRVGAQEMLRQIGESTVSRRHISLSTKLIKRESAGPFLS